VQRRRPLRIGHEHLRHVAGHDRQVDLKRRQRRRVPVQPPHPPRARLRARHVQRCERGLNPGHLDPARGQQAGEAPRPAPDVQHRLRPQLRRDRRVRLQVGPVAVDDVVDRRQPWYLKCSIRHA
jgi:hypothetical protein